MAEIILRTKLFIPPLRPLLVPRPRLLDKLNAGLQGKLSLVSAPAGFGKTTLVVHWLQQQARPVAWLSLDENDNEPLRFFTYLVTAVQTINSDLAEDLAAGLQSSNPPEPTAVVPALLNELADHPDPFVLVLDDYHVINDGIIHTALAFLLDYLPPHIHLVITSRDEPNLPLPRWRVRGQLTDIRAADLRFTNDEATHFLHETMGLDLGVTAVATLETRTEGWAAGLQLAALSLRNSPDIDHLIAQFAGSERQIADYLLQEVLFQQSEPIQQFLLQTAVLDRFNASLCDALLEQENSQDVLDELEQSNLFIIPLDNSRYWYRYHHLFAELLRYRLQRDWSETAVAELHRRAAQWYHSQNLLEEAIHHTYQIPDYAGVAQLLAQIPHQTIFEDGGCLNILKWGERLPPEHLSAYPKAAVLLAGAALIQAKAQESAAYLDLCADDERVRGYQYLYRSNLVRNQTGDSVQALQLAQQALTAVDENNEIFVSAAWGQIAVNYYNLGQLEEADEAIMMARQNLRGNNAAALGMRLLNIELHTINAIAQGDFHRGEKLAYEGIDLVAQGQLRSPFVGIMHTILARIYYEWNEIEQAETHVNEAMKWARRTGISDLLTYSAFMLSNLACYHQDKAALQAALDLFTPIIDDMQMQRASAVVDRLKAWFWLRMGELITAVSWADSCGLTLDDDPAYQDFDAYYALVSIRLAQSRQTNDQRLLPQMLVNVDKLHQLVIASHHVVGLIEALILKALLLDYQGDPAAIATMQQALDLAQSGQMVRTFVDWGEPMQILLTKIPPAHSAYGARLLAAFGNTPAVKKPPSLPITTSADPLIQLTPRESEILQLIVAGLSNKQIEDTLFISKNTVRTHIKNLYSKLGVASRTQAVKQAHDLNLLH